MSTQKPILGGNAVFRDMDELRGRDRNLIKAAAASAAGYFAKLPPELLKPGPEGETPDQMVVRVTPLMEGIVFTWQENLALIELRQATVVAMLQAWDLDQPLPTMETIGDLEGELYDSLDAAVGGVSAAVALGVNLDPSPDPGSPSSDSGS